MAKRIATLAVRLLSANLLVMLVALFVMLPLTGFLKDVALYQWFITAIFAVIMLVIVWFDTTGVGQKDVQKDKFLKRKMAQEGYIPTPDDKIQYMGWLGFAAGFAAQSPFFVLALVAGFAGMAGSTIDAVLVPILRGWNVMYLQVFESFPNSLPWLFLLFPLIYSAVAGLGYRNGPVQQARMEVIIERNKSRKAQRVQDDKKKAQMRKKPTRR